VCNGQVESRRPCETEAARVTWRRRAGSRRGSLDPQRAAAGLTAGGVGALETMGQQRCYDSFGQREAGQS
jgi:hypothetical protein